jgi:hypothetical protein
MRVLSKILLIATVTSFTTQAYASGCDCSCFGVKETVLKADYFEGYKGYGFSITKEGDNLRLHPIPSRWKKMPTDDIIISGYKDRVPIHPELIDRIIAKQPRFYLTVMNQQIEVENDWCPMDVSIAETGRYKIEFTFDTGESVTLYHPSDDVIYDRESGNINLSVLLPSPFNYLQKQQQEKP